MAQGAASGARALDGADRQDADDKELAARTLPTLPSHLQLAHTTHDAVK